MSSDRAENAGEIARAYGEHDRVVIMANVRTGCYLGMLLMPAGSVLDWFVFPDMVGHFMRLRLLCSLLIGVFLGLVVSPLGPRYYRALGVTLAMFPTFFIAWMIYDTGGPTSPYYAGLNLVLLFVGLILHWTMFESCVAFGLVMVIYLGACLLWMEKGALFDTSTYANNLYFLLVTGLIVVVGNLRQSRLRFREFGARHSLRLKQEELEEINRRLVELDRVKNRFFANISHELRTPLTLLLAPLEALMRRQGARWDEEEQQHLRTMQDNGLRLLRLISDLLDLVRVESGTMKVQMEPVEFRGFLGGLVSSVGRVAMEKRLRLESVVSPELGRGMCDRDKLEKVLLNLMFNSIKFTPPGGMVRLKAERVGQDLVLTVSDTGMGIAPEHLPMVFDRFWQADSSSQRKHQGAGIGLALVKELVEVQGGSVTARSQLREGTEMVVRLPWVEPPPAVPGAAGDNGGAIVPVDVLPENPALEGLYRRAQYLAPPGMAWKGAEDGAEGMSDGRLRVLVADDEPDMLRFLKGQLEQRWAVIPAVDGLDALAKARQFRPDAVLLDMMMPEKDGLQVCRELRESTTTRSIPVVMLTARADEETKLQVLAAGANDFLSKPFSTAELMLRLGNAIENYRAQLSVARQKQVLEATVEQLKETEAELVQSEKLASLGRMSAGIIHEINNPLNYAKTNLFALKRLVKTAPEAARPEIEAILKDVEDGLERVRTIVTDLRVFTHSKADSVKWVEAGQAVSMALRFLSHEWRDRVKVVVEVPEGARLMASEGPLIQVLVNLLQNSIDAMEEAGTVDPSILLSWRETEAHWMLVVRDNGPGIASEVLPNIFDPFFTTKDVGKGMGLGLSICHRIVASHGGRLMVRTEVGKYCEFTLEFPKNEQR